VLICINLWFRLSFILCFQYPEKIRELEYKPGYAVRGLHFDVSRGLLLKLDSFLQIQFGSVYRGLTPLSDEEVLDIYKSRTIPLAYVESNRAVSILDNDEELGRKYTRKWIVTYRYGKS